MLHRIQPDHQNKCWQCTSVQTTDMLKSDIMLQMLWGFFSFRLSCVSRCDSTMLKVWLALGTQNTRLGFRKVPRLP